MLIASETSSVYHLSPPLRLYFSFKDVLRKLVKCKVQCLVGTVCPTFLRGAINDRPGVRVTWPRRGEFAQCITNQPPRPPPSSTLLLPRLSTRSPVYPPTASVILSCALPSTPRNTRPSQPSRILVPHSSLFIHPSCTPSIPWHRRRARSPAATTTFLCTLHRADTLGVLNGIVATLLLATSKCRRRRLRRRRRQRSAVPSLIAFLLRSLSLSLSCRPVSLQPFREMEMLFHRRNIRIFYIRWCSMIRFESE